MDTFRETRNDYGLIEAAEELKCEDLTIVTHDESATLLERGHRIVVVPAWKYLI